MHRTIIKEEILHVMKPDFGPPSIVIFFKNKYKDLRTSSYFRLNLNDLIIKKYIGKYYITNNSTNYYLRLLRLENKDEIHSFKLILMGDNETKKLGVEMYNNLIKQERNVNDV